MVYSWKRLGNRICELCYLSSLLLHFNSVRIVDFKHDKKIAQLEWILVERHTLVFQGQNLLRLDDLVARFDVEKGAIKMLNCKLDATDAFLDADFLCHKKIRTSSFEDLMLLLSYDEYNIASFLVRVLISLSVENELFAIWRASIDVALNDLLLLRNSIALTEWALITIWNLLSCTSAKFTDNLGFSEVTRSEHLHLIDFS